MYIHNILKCRTSKKQNGDLHNIHLITCSNKSSCTEMVDGFITDLMELETTGRVMYDAHLKANVLVIAPILLVISDNHRASEIVSHMGSTANKFCRMCMVSTSKQY